MRWLMSCVVLLAACSTTAPRVDADLADAGTDAPAAVDTGPPDAGPSCAALLTERRRACGSLVCAGGPCPDDCADALFAEDPSVWIDCWGSEQVEDACGHGCLVRAPGPRLCGGGRGADCGPDAYCDGSCGSSEWVAGVCLPRPVSCDPAAARVACVCDGSLHWDECEAHRAGASTSRFCNLLPHGPCESRLPFPEVRCEETVTAWLWDGYDCVAGEACPGERNVFTDEALCRSVFAGCAHGPAGSLRDCRDRSVCEDNEVCLFPPEDPCGREGSSGRCQVGADGCFRVAVPIVCGCDGVTYGGACDALLVGRTAVAHAGTCEGAD